MVWGIFVCLFVCLICDKMYFGENINIWLNNQADNVRITELKSAEPLLISGNTMHKYYKADTMILGWVFLSIIYL